jgi:hypothetical protein
LNRKRFVVSIFVTVLIVGFLGMTFLYWTTNGSLQTFSDDKRYASENLGGFFLISINRANDIGYLSRPYSNPYPNPRVSENETIEATVDGFFHETEYADLSLRALKDLHGVSTESSIYNASILLEVRVNGWDNLSDGSMPVQAVLGHLLDEAALAGNYTKPIMAFDTLHNATQSAFTAFGLDVASWSYQPSNSTLLSNIGTDVDQLEKTLIQWSNSYR